MSPLACEEGGSETLRITVCHWLTGQLPKIITATKNLGTKKAVRLGSHCDFIINTVTLEPSAGKQIDPLVSLLPAQPQETEGLTDKSGEAPL